MAKRNFPDWIDAFVQATEATGSPLRLRVWAAIACVAGVMERKRWVYTAGSNLYPNLYTVFVAPPGVGKSKVLEVVRRLWTSLEGQRVAHASVTKASLVDELADAERIVTVPTMVPPTLQFNSLKILSSELGVLLPDFANDFMNTLTHLYDGDPYSERRRTSKLNIEIRRPQLNILAATTPSYLKALLPEGAWDQGFLSRTILIYSAEQQRQSLFAEGVGESYEKPLQADLRSIGDAFGPFTFSEEAAAAIDAWHLAGGPPTPEHPKLQHYLTRRTAHLLKLCMVAAGSAGSPEIALEHYQRALEWLIEAEHFIPEIFKSMASGGDAVAIKECWHAVMQYNVKKKAPAPEAFLIRFLQDKVPSHSIERIILLMVKGGLLKEEHVNKIGKCYSPLEKHRFE